MSLGLMPLLRLFWYGTKCVCVCNFVYAVCK
jgi:hypothetical protein